MLDLGDDMPLLLLWGLRQPVPWNNRVTTFLTLHTSARSGKFLLTLNCSHHAFFRIVVLVTCLLHHYREFHYALYWFSFWPVTHQNPYWLIIPVCSDGGASWITFRHSPSMSSICFGSSHMLTSTYVVWHRFNFDWGRVVLCSLEP